MSRWRETGAMLAAFALAVGTARADDGEVGTIFIKNNGHSSVAVWVNDAYQGYAPAGQCRYTVSDGFVTYNSDRQQEDGSRTAREHSHAGWLGHGPVVVQFQYWAEEGINYRSNITLEGDSKKEAYVSVAETDPGLPPDSFEAESAAQILPGLMPASDWAPLYRGEVTFNPTSGDPWTKIMPVRYKPTERSLKYKFTDGADGPGEYGSTDLMEKDGAYIWGRQYSSEIDAFKIAVAADKQSLMVTSTGRNTGGSNAGRKWKSESTLAAAVKPAATRAMRTGDVQVTVSWTGAPDVDLSVVDPAGSTIDFEHKHSPSGGQLDLDDTNGNGPENIFWPRGGAPDGPYQVYVKLFKGDSAQCRVQVMHGTKRETYNVTLSEEKEAVKVCEFDNHRGE